MTDSGDNSYSDEELAVEFDRLFPQGFAGPDVLQELAPAGWDKSPLLAVFHPSAEQIHEESERLHANLEAFRKPDRSRPLPPEPTLEELRRDHRNAPLEPEREVRELVGQCLWDVFSDAHEVIAAEGRVLDLGSFRGSGEFLADLLNRQIEAEQYDYLDFYLGTIHVSQRADLGPVYRMLFRRLRSRGFDWVYQFPRVCAIDMAPLKEALDRKDESDWMNYSPSEAMAKEEEKKDREKRAAELSESLDEGYREAIEEALKHPPPTTVQAYQSVYGRYPRGWPPAP